MNGFILQDMKRSFLNVGFFAGMAAVAALLTCWLMPLVFVKNIRVGITV